MSSVGMSLATRMGISGRRLETASSISRATWGELFAAALNTTTTASQPWIACTIPAPHCVPALRSRGAIQQEMPAVSSASRMASALIWSGEE